MTEDELLLRMVEAEQNAPQEKMFSRIGQRTGSVLSHPDWTDPPWATVEQAFDRLLQRRLVVLGPNRTYIIAEIGYDVYHQLLNRQPDVLPGPSN